MVGLQRFSVIALALGGLPEYSTCVQIGGVHPEEANITENIVKLTGCSVTRKNVECCGFYRK